MAEIADPRLQELIDALLSNGWRLEGPVDISNDWWFKDILCLTSTIRPVGSCLYLTLLTDPQEIRKKIVWCIGISPTIPTDRHFEYLHQLSLKDVKKTDLTGLVRKINFFYGSFRRW